MDQAQQKILLYTGVGLVATLAGYGISKILRGLSAVHVPDCKEITSSGGTVAGLRYIERLSPGASPDQALPMVVLFHSRGATPQGFAGFAGGLKAPARVILPEGPGVLGSNRTWFTLPARTSDQQKLEAQMRWTGRVAAKFLRDIVQCRPTVGLPVVTGSSQGGSMSYMMGNLYPDLVRGAVPVAGWIPKPMWSRDMAVTTGIHGSQDKTVPYAWTSAEIARMKALGAPISLASFPVGHTVSSGMSKAWKEAVNSYIGAFA